EGIGPKCWHCDKDTDTDVCRQNADNRFVPEAVLNAQFCSNVRNNKGLVKQLCDKYSVGYKVYCRSTNNEEHTCNHLCPVEPQRQFGGGGSSSHSASFIMVLVAMLLALQFRKLFC
ncbi:hypothetical protein BaRGS_00019599, partial [Batillaria attramentaria]